MIGPSKRLASLVLAMAAACVLSLSLVSAVSAAPASFQPTTIVKYGFESPTDTFAELAPFPNYNVGDYATSAYWGRTLATSFSGSGALWCAGRVAGSNTTSTAWPFYPRGTRGSAITTFTVLSNYYSSSIRMHYKMPSIGSYDYFKYGWQAYSQPGSPSVATELSTASNWTTVTADVSSSHASPSLSRSPGRIYLEFYDTNEGSSADETGTGPVVDDFELYGYKYGPVRSMAVTNTDVGGQNYPLVTWTKPAGSTLTSVVDARGVEYRVFRAQTGGADTAIELTSDGARATGLSYTDMTAIPGLTYQYWVQAADPGSGTGYGEVASPVTWGIKPLTLSAPSKPSRVYTWKSFTSTGTITAHSGVATVAIECFRSKTGSIVKSYSAKTASGGSTYSGTVALPASGTWYLRTKHQDVVHGLRYSSWSTVTVSSAVVLSTPHVPTTATHGTTFTSYGTVQPRHSSGTYLRVYAYRLSGSTYVYKTSFTVSVTSYAQPAYTTKWTARVKLPTTGYWKLRVKHTAHGSEATGYSAYSARIKVN